MKTLALFALLLPSIELGSAAPRDDDVRTSRELAGIAEEQALLRRQLVRLRETMEVLAGRLEAEGRPKAVELLRRGLTMLEERGQEEADALTLLELMESSGEAVHTGQLVRSIERQEAPVMRLGRLLDVLLDRRDLESLEEKLEELEELSADLGALRDRESELQRETKELRERSTDASQRELVAGLNAASDEQRELLKENEELGRASGCSLGVSP